MEDYAKAGVALTLTFAAGCVDIIGFRSLYHTFTAHMTGVTVHLGQDIIDAYPRDALVLLATLGAFVLGSVLGRTLVEIGKRNKLRSAAATSLALEFVLLVSVGAAGAVPQWKLAMILVLAGAMGVQTATLTRIGPLTVHTTFVTGMLNKLAQLLSKSIFLAYDVGRGKRDRARLRPVVHRKALFMLSIWVLYLTGAVIGTDTQTAWGVRALFLPAGIVLLVTIFDQMNPLAIQVERDKSEQ